MRYTDKQRLDWLESVGLPRLPVTNVKDFSLIELWDDRCVRVEPNTGRPIVSDWEKVDPLAWPGKGAS
jgi:hypothetical protein